MKNFTQGKIKLGLLSGLFVFITITVFSQSSVTIGDPTLNPPKYILYNTYGPMRSVTAAFTAGPISNRHAYIYPKASFSTVVSQSVIDSLAFYKIFAGQPQGTVNLKIYLKNTGVADFGTDALTWSTEIATATLVYNDNPTSAITVTEGFKIFKFISGFLYTGSNLAVYIEYTQAGPTTDYVSWLYDNVSYPFGDHTLKYAHNTSDVFPATLTNDGTIHPVLKLFYTPPPPAPLKLIDFSVTSSSAGNQLKWITSKEENLAGFTIEKSKDGTGFAPIVTIAAFNQTAKSSYSYADKAANMGTVYYRLKMNDKNGAFSYSRVVSVSSRGKANFHVYPNPAKEVLQVQLPAARGSSTLNIIDVSGRILITKQIELTESGTISTSMDVRQLPAGLYHIVLYNSATKQVQQFIKQ